MHPALRFTLEKENNFTLSFLDVLVYKETSAFLTAWFCPKKWKINLIETLTHRALMICSKSKMDDEVDFITGTLCNNGFPEDIVRSVIRDKISDFSKIKPDSVQVYLRLSWLGDISDRFANQISACVRKYYLSSHLRVVFHTWTVLTSGQKDVLPTQHNSSLIFFF